MRAVSTLCVEMPDGLKEMITPIPNHYTFYKAERDMKDFCSEIITTGSGIHRKTGIMTSLHTCLFAREMISPHKRILLSIQVELEKVVMKFT